MDSTSSTAEQKAAAYLVVNEANDEVVAAQSALYQQLASPDYMLWKRAITGIGSLVLGLCFSLSANLQLFEALGVSINDIPDKLLTGLLIGAGPGPIHAVINLLNEVRNLAGGAANLAKGNALKKVAESKATENLSATEKLSAIASLSVNANPNPLPAVFATPVIQPQPEGLPVVAVNGR